MMDEIKEFLAEIELQPVDDEAISNDNDFFFPDPAYKFTKESIASLEKSVKAIISGIVSFSDELTTEWTKIKDGEHPTERVIYTFMDKFAEFGYEMSEIQTRKYLNLLFDIFVINDMREEESYKRNT